MKEVAGYLEEGSSIEHVIFVCFNDLAHESYAVQLKELGVTIDDTLRVN